MANTVKTEEDKSGAILDLTLSVAQLTHAVQIMNDVLLVLVHNAKKNGIEIPEWRGKEDVEADVASTIQSCIDMMKEAYGRDKSNHS